MFEKEQNELLERKKIYQGDRNRIGYYRINAKA